MDRPLWEKHLALAEHHIEVAERNIQRQKEILAELARDGHPTQTAAGGSVTVR